MQTNRLLIPALLLLASVTPSLPCQAANRGVSALLEDAKLYVTAPIRWDERDWTYFGGALLAVAAAHEYDDNVRTHFDTHVNTPLDTPDTHDSRDYVPAAAMIGLTWAYATLVDDRAGYSEGRAMLEAAAFSAGTTTLLKLASGRKRPNETDKVDDWFAGGGSFPSMHVSITFAVGTVLAESGNDEFRWIRRALGYGLATATAYARVHDGAHWLSDTVAAAALGAATGRFVVNRVDARDPRRDAFSVIPTDGGALLTWTRTLR